MVIAARFTVFAALVVTTAAALPAAAQYGPADGYGQEAATHELEVSHDGYAREGQPSVTADPTTYVVIEAETGTTEQVDGETVIVVQEPQPVAATAQAPPVAKNVIIVEQPEVRCQGGIWVDGYWGYSNGDYVWVDGHCVVERTNYVFVHPRWDFYANVWWFVPGYYRPCGVWVGFGYHRPWHWYPPHHGPYYRGHRPVPVHRGVPRRPTTVHPTRVSRAPSRPSRGVVARPTTRPTRTTGVQRPLPPGYRRVDTVSRAPTVQRAPSVTRTPNVSRTPTVSREPSATRTATISRGSSTPVLTRTVPRSPSTSRAVITRPGSGSSGSARTGAVRRPSASGSRAVGVTRPSSGVSRASSVSRPSFGGSRGGGFKRPSMGSSRSSFGGFGGGGFKRPTSGGFGGNRAAPVTRGR